MASALGTDIIDLSTVGAYGSESDPRAYRFDGELNVANHGLMEFIEMLKADERFLYVLLTLSQEKNIKTGRFPLIYADECVISHTNETEFNEFLGNKKSEALRSIEEKVQGPEHGKDSFRNQIFRKVAMANRHGAQFDYTTPEKLKEAIEKQLFEERRDTIKLTIASRSPDTEQLRKLNEVVETLVTREGYCSACANELLKYVSSLLAREK
jgi:predicted Ser/Thr protein kinase